MLPLYCFIFFVFSNMSFQYSSWLGMYCFYVDTLNLRQGPYEPRFSLKHHMHKYWTICVDSVPILLDICIPIRCLIRAQTSLAPLSRFRGSRVTTAHAHQCCIFQSYAKTVPSRMKLTMKLTMREPTFMGSMTTDTWSRRVTSDFNSVFWYK